VIRRFIRHLRTRRQRQLIDRSGDQLVFNGSIRKARDASVFVGNDCAIYGAMICNCAGASITLGDRCFVNSGCVLDSSVRITIGSDVLMARDVLVFDHNSHSLAWEERRNDLKAHLQGGGAKDWSVVAMAPVVVGERCWIGARAIILKGVSLGPGCVVGAGAVVTKSFPANSLIAGNPAKLIRTIDPLALAEESA
jgi:acetyltransferase-like isoleucine patch superfamily enzyme